MEPGRVGVERIGRLDDQMDTVVAIDRDFLRLGQTSRRCSAPRSSSPVAARSWRPSKRLWPIEFALALVGVTCCERPA
jgi:hypothetical protein